MTSPLTTLVDLLPTAAPEKQRPLKSALKLSPHHPFYRREASPELPQDSNTDALDDSDVLELSMTADSAIACTPPLSVTDSADDVDDLFSPLSPLPPFHDHGLHSYYLQHHTGAYHHSLPPQTATKTDLQPLDGPVPARNYPFDASDRGLVSLPDKGQIAQRLYAAGSALESTPQFLMDGKEDKEKEEAGMPVEVPRAAVSFQVDQHDGEETEEEENNRSSPTLAPVSSPLTHASSQPPVAAVAQVSTPVDRIQHDAVPSPSSSTVSPTSASCSSAAPSFQRLHEDKRVQEDGGKNECKDSHDDKGVDTLGHDLSIQSNLPSAVTTSSEHAPTHSATATKTLTTVASTKKPSTCNKTDDLLGHILIEQAPSDMLVALFDRPSELQALATRNADYFAMLYTQIGAASRAAFKQLLFAPREEKCDLTWMRELARYLKAQPCVLEKFQNLVGWVGPDEYDDEDCGKKTKKKGGRAEELDGYDEDDEDDDEDDYDEDGLWGEDQYGYRNSSYEQIQIKWIRDYPERLAAFRKEYPQLFINARERLGGKRLSYGGDRRDLYEIFCETLFLTREQLRCDNAWTRRMNGCLDKHPDLLLQLKEIIAYEIGWDD
ncbi:hypothetical protein BGZ73_007340 [Actinomortierella ambigua]|nr:hypothetical protein BGZ73_007340 [Actinomortierella ambigua]